MKTILIGRKGAGVTTFIKTKLIPNLKSYVVIDFTGEYKGMYEIHCGSKYSFKERREIVEKVFSNPEYETIILDNAIAFLNPDKDCFYNLSFKWLMDLCHAKNVIFNCYNWSDMKNLFYVSHNSEAEIYLFSVEGQ